MKQRPRIYYTEADKSLMWDRWQKGESLNAIARLFDRHHSAIQGILSRTGGIRPSERRRSRLALTIAEREEISRGVVAGHSIRSIAMSLGRAPSTVSREISRNGGRRRYRANQADRAAWDQARRPKICKLAENRALARIVAEKLQLEWSPRQIAGWLKRTYPSDENDQVSHETIYRTLFIQARGALKKELLQHLAAHACDASFATSHAEDGGSWDASPMLSRSVNARHRWKTAPVPGHWEGDLLFGSNNSQIATLVERHSRYVMLARVKSKDTETVINALIKQAHKLPRELYKSLTWDRGKEMADHKRFSLDTNIKVYFCDPQSPWQRGSNENTNGLVRQYFPKGMDLSNVHQNRLNAVARRLNERPRETLELRNTG